MGLEKYRQEYGAYPVRTSPDAVTREFFLKKTDPSEVRYLIDIQELSFDESGNCLDPWGRPMEYRYPGQYNKSKYDLWSEGPKSDTDKDDITNWTR